MIENPPHDGAIADQRDQFAPSAAMGAFEDVDRENSLEKVSPGGARHARMAPLVSASTHALPNADWWQRPLPNVQKVPSPLRFDDAADVPLRDELDDVLAEITGEITLRRQSLRRGV